MPKLTTVLAFYAVIFTVLAAAAAVSITWTDTTPHPLITAPVAAAIAAGLGLLLAVYATLLRVTDLRRRPAEDPTDRHS